MSIESLLKLQFKNFGLSKFETVAGRILSVCLLFSAPLSFGETKIKEFYGNRQHFLQVALLRKALPWESKIELAKQRANDLTQGALVGLENNPLKPYILKMVPNALDNLKKYPQMLNERDLIKIGDEAKCKNAGAYFDFRYRYVYLCPTFLDNESIDFIAGAILHELTHRIQKARGSHHQKECEATQMEIIIQVQNGLAPQCASYASNEDYGVNPITLVTYIRGDVHSIDHLKPGMKVSFKPSLIQVSRMNTEGHYVYSGNDGWEFSIRVFPRNSDHTENSESTTHEISEVTVEYGNKIGENNSVVIDFADGPIASILVVSASGASLAVSAVEAMLYETIDFNLPTP